MKRFGKYVGILLIMAFSSAASAQEEDFCGNNGDRGGGCPDETNTIVGKVWRMEMTSQNPERFLDIDFTAYASGFTPIPGGQDVELAHLVFGEGAERIRMPIRLKREGTAQAPAVTYTVWVDGAQGQTIMPMEQLVGTTSMVSIPLHVRCGTGICFVKFGGIGNYMFPRPQNGSRAFIEFGMKAGYSYAVPGRERFFKPLVP